MGEHGEKVVEGSLNEARSPQVCHAVAQWPRLQGTARRAARVAAPGPGARSTVRSVQGHMGRVTAVEGVAAEAWKSTGPWSRCSASPSHADKK
jgi:hypothetical protein